MNEDEEEADEEEQAIQAAQQPASEADFGPSIEEVDAAIRLVSEGLTHHTYLLLLLLLLLLFYVYHHYYYYRCCCCCCCCCRCCCDMFGLHMACMQPSPKLGHGRCQECACITFVVISHGAKACNLLLRGSEACVVCLVPNCVVMWR